MPADEQLQLCRELRRHLELEVGRDPVFEHAQPQILEAMDLVLREVLQLRVGKRPASPESKRLAEQAVRRSGSASRAARRTSSKRVRSS